VPVLDEFVDAAEGKVDRDFWRSFFRDQSGSGPSELTGWIHVFYPYLQEAPGGAVRRNPFLAKWERGIRIALARKQWVIMDPQGPAIEALPSGLASAPVSVSDLRTGLVHAMRFVGGMIGVAQDPSTLALEPEFFWAIMHDARRLDALPTSFVAERRWSPIFPRKAVCLRSEREGARKADRMYTIARQA
jgi:hypothetical protein